MPRFSLVVAVRDPEQASSFTASVANQTYGDVELIVVGPEDAADETAARNLGLARATGDWVAFPDPAHTLDPDHLRAIDAFLTARPETQVALANRIRRDGTSIYPGFANGDRLRDLDHEPTSVIADPSAAFLRRADMTPLDERIRPHFALGHLVADHLLRSTSRKVGFVRSATYTGVDGQVDHVEDADRYTAVLRHGYLDLLNHERNPGWVQHLVLWELADYFRAEQIATRQSVAVEDVADETHALLADIAARLDPAIVDSFTLRGFAPQWREMLRHGYDPRPWHTSHAVIDKVDVLQRTMRVTYRFTHERPAECFRVDGVEVTPVHGKIRSEPFLRRTLLHERIAWLPYGTLTLDLEGTPADLRTDEPEPPRLVFEAWRARDRRRPQPVARERERPSPVLALARSRPVRLLLRHAWVLIDRVHDADDSAEHLFGWLRRHRRRVNAWFVIARGTADYRRLKRRHPVRVVAYGSLRWKLLMINCRQLISSHADVPVTDPPAILELIGTPTWRFAFLQHGVTKDDLSPWLNTKDIDVFVTSTPGEYHAVVDDGTAYRYTTREAVLTGLPRFDVLRAAAKKEKRRDLLLVAPTWRSWLAKPPPPDSHTWRTDFEQMRASEFVRRWRELLADPALAETGLTVALLMHVNLAAVVDALDLPPHVQRLDFTDVRTTFARARVLVTDYSSMAFNAAYLDRPVVYYQFDRDRVLAGGHVGRRGYFDYERDGFGPVTRTAPEAAAAVVRALADPAPEYARRVAEAFPQRDGRCCERTADAIAASMQRVPWDPP